MPNQWNCLPKWVKTIASKIIGNYNIQDPFSISGIGIRLMRQKAY